MAGFKNLKVSVVIVTFNSRKYIEECLKAVLTTEYDNFEILLIDNASSDGTSEIVAENFPRVQLIKNQINLGYAGGNNLGAKLAKGGLLAFLNPDTKVTKQWLKPLVESIGSKEVFACQPKILLPQTRGSVNLINGIGKTTHFLGFDWLTDYRREDYDFPVREITSFSGSAVLIKKDIFQKLGGFDENYFMYYEDGDLSWRMRLAGYKILVNPNSVVYHNYKYIPVEGYLRKKRKFYLLERNRLVNLLKNYSLRSLILLLPAMVVMELCLNLYFFSKGWYLEKPKGYLWIFRHLSKIWQKRKVIQRERTITDKDVTRNFVGRFNFSEFNNSLLKYIVNPVLGLYWRLMSLLI